MIKKYSGHIIGFLSSIVFFMSLAYIVKPSSESLKNENSFRVVDFIRLKKDTSLKEKSRTIPDKPEPPKKPPPPKLETPEVVQPVQNLNIKFPTLNTPVDLKGAFLRGANSLASNSGLIPLVKIQPKYPREALKGGKTGFVTVRLTVDEKGRVISAIIEESRPPRIFDAAAIQAVLKWKFKPRVIDGVPVKQVGLTTIEFNL